MNGNGLKLNRFWKYFFSFQGDGTTQVDTLSHRVDSADSKQGLPSYEVAVSIFKIKINEPFNPR